MLDKLIDGEAMKDSDLLNYEIIKEKGNPPVRKSVAVVKGISAADHTVDRLMRNMSEKDKEAAVSYFHKRTTKAITAKPKKKTGSGPRTGSKRRRER
jgi:hypothetical protein